MFGEGKGLAVGGQFEGLLIKLMVCINNFNWVEFLMNFHNLSIQSCKTAFRSTHSQHHVSPWDDNQFPTKMHNNFLLCLSFRNKQAGLGCGSVIKKHNNGHSNNFPPLQPTQFIYVRNFFVSPFTVTRNERELLLACARVESEYIYVIINFFLLQTFTFGRLLVVRPKSVAQYLKNFINSSKLEKFSNL